MPITERQREMRRKYLGSSDAPAIAGVNPWRNAADVYWDKIKPPSDRDSEPKNDAVIVGNLCEKAVLDWFEKEAGEKIRRNQSRVHSNKIMAANIDALMVGKPEIVEAKTSGITSYFDKEAWGEPGTDEVPDYVIVQCHHQMAVLGEEYRVAWVPVLLGGVGFRMYRIERSDQLVGSLESIEVDFWRSYVEPKVVPPNNLPTIETIKRIDRTPSKVVSIADTLVENWIKTRELASTAEKEKKEAQRALLAALGDAEAGECSFGTVTYFEQNMKERIIPECSYRVARFKQNKNYKEAAA